MSMMEDADRAFVDYLRDGLIPDLYASGMTCTAEDIAQCVQIIEKLESE